VATEPSDGHEPEDPASAPAAPGGLSSGKKIVIAAAGALVLVAGGVLIGGQLGGEEDPAAQATLIAEAPAPSEPTAEAPVTPGPQETAEPDSPEGNETVSESETNYATYLESLSPEQKSVRESLSPDNLAGMDQSQLTEAFTIKADEATDANGQIDPALYAEAFAARDEAILNSGCSEIEYAKWGGLDSFGTTAMSQAVDHYFIPESTALFGHPGDSESAMASLARCTTTELLRSGSDDKPEPYHVRVAVKENSLDVADPANFSFELLGTDNLDVEAFQTRLGLIGEPTNFDDTCNISGLYVADNGAVLSASIESN